MKIYNAEEVYPLILNGSLKGKYAVIGSLRLTGYDLTNITLPSMVSRWLYIDGCKNPDPSQWWSEYEQPTKRHCLAISNYALIETEDGFYYAGCRGPWTAKMALEHWGPLTGQEALLHWGPCKVERAKLFVEAIKANEKRKGNLSCISCN